MKTFTSFKKYLLLSLLLLLITNTNLSTSTFFDNTSENSISLCSLDDPNIF